MDRTKVDFLSFISLEDIHVAGIAIVAFIMAAFLANIWIMYRAMRRGPHGAAFSMSNLKGSSIRALREVALQERFGECEDNKFRRWAHLAVSWGFMGMFLATCIIARGRFQMDSAPAVGVARRSARSRARRRSSGSRTTSTCRFGRRSEYAKRSHQTDWVFLVLLALSVVSGYVMVAFRFMHMPMAAYGAFAFHLVVRVRSSHVVAVHEIRARRVPAGRPVARRREIDRFEQEGGTNEQTETLPRRRASSS